MSWPHVARRVTQDKRVLDPAALYSGGLLLATAGGASTVAVYDGIDATGDLIDYFSVVASAHERHPPDNGIPLKRGLYVDLGDNVSSFVIYYDPTPRELG